MRLSADKLRAIIDEWVEEEEIEAGWDIEVQIESLVDLILDAQDEEEEDEPIYDEGED